MEKTNKLRDIRKAKNLSVEYLAEQLDISVATYYRYESSDYDYFKIPVRIFDKLCTILGVSPGVILGNDTSNTSDFATDGLPETFENAADAIKFILQVPMIASYGGYDISKLSDEDLLEFTNDLLLQLQMLSFKYK